MRLLKLGPDGGFSLVELIENVPRYAILSHTWLASKDEVTFEDLNSGGGKHKKGYGKLEFCARQAAKDHLQYIWVDTCCIDKRSSAELQEAINSMFRWYRDSTKCYVYLTDVSAGNFAGEQNPFLEPEWQSAFESSRWFTRGWTLQELIAPRSVEFFSVEGHRIRDKISLIHDIHRITGVAIRALHGEPLSHFDVYERFSWATRRQTTRAEDIAYSLLGIFGVFLPLLYGEGEEEARRRLREEISNAQSRVKRVHDVESDSNGSHDVKRLKLKPIRSSTISGPPWAGHMKEVIESLRFPQMETRHRTIKRTHAETCKWFLETPEYRAWLDASSEADRFFHIRGKPGSGKSSLMKFLLRHTQELMKKEVFLSFFFNARGTELEKSTTGTYQALLVQLLDLFPHLGSILSAARFSTVKAENATTQKWDSETLQELLLQASSELKHASIMCFIDALDECEEQQIRDMVSFLEDLSDCALEHGNRIRICFASRYYPNVSIRTKLKIDLDTQIGHKEDIKTYLENKLYIENQALAGKVHQRLLEKASGVFLWIVLVVPMLKKVCDTGHSFDIQTKISEVPNDVHELFRDIITRDSTKKRELALCIQWVLFAKRPMNAVELFVAIRFGTAKGRPVRFDFELSDISDMERYVLDVSKGLTETTKATDRTPTIQFIHESVRDFLLKKNGLVEICPELIDNPEGRTHEQLKDFCYTYIKAADIFDLNLSMKDSPRAYTNDFTRLHTKWRETFPLLRYALDNLLYHADKAGAKKMSQKTFLRNFEMQMLKPWEKYPDELPQPDFEARIRNDSSLLFVLAKNNFAHLLKILDTDSKAFLLPPSFGFFHSPLIEAIFRNSAAAAQVMLEKVAVESGLENRRCLKWRSCFKNGNWRGDIPNHARLSNPQSWLSCLAKHGHEEIFALLLESRLFDMDKPDYSCRSALWYSCHRGNEKIIRLLLDKNAKFISEHSSGCKLKHVTRSALHAASEAGHCMSYNYCLTEVRTLMVEGTQNQRQLCLLQMTMMDICRSLEGSMMF